MFPTHTNWALNQRRRIIIRRGRRRNKNHIIWGLIEIPQSGILLPQYINCIPHNKYSPLVPGAIAIKSINNIWQPFNIFISGSFVTDLALSFLSHKGQEAKKGSSIYIGILRIAYYYYR